MQCAHKAIDRSAFNKQKSRDRKVPTFLSWFELPEDLQKKHVFVENIHKNSIKNRVFRDIRQKYRAIANATALINDFFSYFTLWSVLMYWVLSQ